MMCTSRQPENSPVRGDIFVATISQLVRSGIIPNHNPIGVSFNIFCGGKENMPPLTGLEK